MNRSGRNLGMKETSSTEPPAPPGSGARSTVKGVSRPAPVDNGAVAAARNNGLGVIPGTGNSGASLG